MVDAPGAGQSKGLMALPASFDLCFAPTIHLVSVARRFVMALYERIVDDPWMSSQLGLATHELLENAVKFNTDAETLLRLTMAPQGETRSEVCVTVRTRNRATAENIRTAARLITEVREAEDPFMFYQQLMQASANQSAGSGLGLARIRAETEMMLDFEIEGDAIEIVVQAQVRPGGRA